MHWLWVTLPDVYTEHAFRVGEEFRWTCHRESEPGDIALLYRADLFQDFSHVFRVTSGQYYDEELAEAFGSDAACDCVLVAALQTPVILSQIRDDPVLSRWPAALANFHGTAFPMEPQHWRAFLSLATPLDRPHLRNVGGAVG